MIIVKCGRKCRREINVEAVDAGGRGEQDDKYQKLIRKLLTRYEDDMDEFGDMDVALREQFDRVTSQIKELKTQYEKKK